MYKSIFLSPIGKIILTCDQSCDNLTGLYFDGQKYLPNWFKNLEIKDDLKIFQDVKRQLSLYFNGKSPDFASICLKPKGTSFQIMVWNVLLSVDYGKTITYGEIANIVAKKLGRPKMSARAVGYAVGHNPISIIIPCHRVLGKNQQLTGYAGGIAKKQFLLNLEKRL